MVVRCREDAAWFPNLQGMRYFAQRFGDSATVYGVPELNPVLSCQLLRMTLNLSMRTASHGKNN